MHVRHAMMVSRMRERKSPFLTIGTPHYSTRVRQQTEKTNYASVAFPFSPLKDYSPAAHDSLSFTVVVVIITVYRDVQLE